MTMKTKGTLGKLKEKEREIRKTIIVDAARKVFEKKTYDAVSMAEIARVAGMAKSSIYTYFSNQEALYVEVACRDSQHYIQDLKRVLKASPTHPIRGAIDHFIDYYVQHKAKWRMITHFALHGESSPESLDRLNQVSRQLMDLFESIIIETAYHGDTRLLAHSLFSSLSGILIAFRNYPGRTESERIAHMKKIGGAIEQMMLSFITSQTT